MRFTKQKVTVSLFAGVCALVLFSAAITAADERVRVPGAQPRERVPAKDANVVKGTLASVDVEKNTLTITTRTFDRKTAESTETKKIYPLAKDAKILQDDTETKLKDLKTGNLATVKLDGANAVSVSIDGGTSQGRFLSANKERNTISIIAGRDDAKRVVHLLKTTKVLGADGKPVKLEDLKRDTKLLITRSVEDDNTAVRVQVMPERQR